MVADSFGTLVRAVIGASEATDWDSAVTEWDVTGLDEDSSGRGECVCGQQNLVKLFTIENRHNARELYPIGSTCVNQFGRTDLNTQIDVFAGLHRLRKAYKDGQRVPLTSDFFSRAMLEHLWEQQAFTPDKFNNQNGESDYRFLLKMFNKRNKDSITKAQQQKIYMLLRHKVRSFVLEHDRLK